MNKRNNTKNQKGFTLIEILVVVFIIGLLATIILPKIMGRQEEAQRTKAMADIKNIQTALDLFKLDNGFYPSTEQGLEALVKKPETGRIPEKWKEGGYLNKSPKDPWGKPYVYLSPGSHGDYDLISFGADGEAGGEGKNADIESWNL
ncbi:MAG: type II secretion system major pseudopilin GspG [Nitrospirae bacterium]|nr:type II secretion system major pseudopilin GspG [Nitrospirota bacterium]